MTPRQSDAEREAEPGWGCCPGGQVGLREIGILTICSPSWGISQGSSEERPLPPNKVRVKQTAEIRDHLKGHPKSPVEAKTRAAMTKV